MPKRKRANGKKKAVAAVAANEVAWDRLEALAEAIAARREADPKCRTARLIAAGIPKMAQKVVEEATEVAIDAVRGERTAVINEAADLFYNLTVLISELGIRPADIWAEMDRRTLRYGIAEKLPKPALQGGEG